MPVRNHEQTVAKSDRCRPDGSDLQQERRSFYNMLEQIPAPICFLRGPKHVFEFMNARYRQLRGCGDGSALLGRSIFEVGSAFDVADLTTQLDQVYRTGDPFIPKEVCAFSDQKNPDQQESRFFNLTYQPSRDSRGQVDGILVHGVDVTELVLAREQSERLAFERQELERRKDEFISMTGHELKTPITTIKANLQLAQRWIKKMTADPSSAPAKVGQIEDLLNRSLRQVDIQKRLIDDLVDVSRIQLNKLQLSLKICNLVVIVHNVVKDQRMLTTDRSIILDLPPVREIAIQADEDRIGQVINNYLTNALKYSPEDQPVKVGLRLEDQQVRVWVQDSGPGIPPEELQNIWERFHQVLGIHEQKGSSGAGLGLGLYICRELIQRQGGKVGVDSSPGKGSCFWFRLPILHDSI